MKKKYLFSQNNLPQFQFLLENSQEIILFFDITGRITGCSKKAKEELGYGEDIYGVFIGSIFIDVFTVKDNHIYIEESHKNSLHEAVAYRKNQTCFPVDLHLTENMDQGLYTGFCTAVNIEERKNTAREIAELKREVSNNSKISSELVAKVAHELRTPLNGIIGFINNLMEMDLRPDQKETVNIINICANNLSSLINELMDYSVLSTKRYILEEKPFVFMELIQYVIDFNIGSINDKGLKFMKYISEDIPEKLIGDELRLTQILNILFSNAVKFTPAGQISLEILKLDQTEQDVELLFMINDTGIGIEHNKMGQLFRSFSQLDSSISRKYGGTGLGLSICKKYIEAMNGTISVDSEKDKGSTFSFRLRFKLTKEQGIFVTESEGIQYKDLNIDNEGNPYNDIAEIDYINQELMNLNLKNAAEIKEQGDTIRIDDLLESIAICIEMENWEKAEQLACKLKYIYPKNESLKSKDILRLLFSIRKEIRIESLSILKEIKTNIR